MQKYQEWLTKPLRGSSQLIPAAGASVTVKKSDGTLATLYSDNGTTQAANPLTTDSSGYFGFYAADGIYSFVISGAGIETRTLDGIQLEDPADGNAALTASSGAALIGYGASGTGAALRTLQDKVRERVSLDDFAGADDNAKLGVAHSALSSSGGVLRFTPRTYSFSFTQPPTNVTWEMDGPEIQRTQLGGSAGVRFRKATYGYLAGPHATDQVALQGIRAIAQGSNQIGAQYADYALHVQIEKENWSEASGNPVAGEINGISLITRNGCVTGDAVKTGGAAILANIGATAGSGFTQLLEAVNSVFTKGTLAVQKQTNIQLLGIDEKTASSHGAVFTSLTGTQTAAIKVSGTAASPWGRILENIKDTITNFVITDAGQIRWRQTATMTLDQEASTNDLVFKTETGTEIARLSSARAQFQARTSINVQAVAAYTIDATTDLDRTIMLANGSAMTCTLPNNAPAGFKCRVVQRDAGQVTFSAASGATLRNVDGHTKTKGQHAVADLFVYANSGGAAAIWYLSGATAL